MTPQERASTVVMDFYAKRTWGYDPNQHAEYEGLIAAAIEAAVAEEREACAKVAENIATVYDMDRYDREEDLVGLVCKTRENIVAAIRARGHP